MRLMQLFSNKDGTLCPVRTFGIGFALLASSVYLALAVWTVVHDHQPLDYVSFGTGASTIWLVASAAIVGKSHWGDK